MYLGSSKNLDFNSRKNTYPTIEDYLKIFQQAAKDIDASGNSSYHPKVVGDCSAATMWEHFCWKLLKENSNTTIPVHTIADVIHHLYQKSKIIAILRNPVDRMYSGYLFFFKTNKSAADFHQRVQGAIKCYHECFRLYSERFCLLFPPGDGMVRLNIGLYYFFISDFMRVFPGNQILILKTEDYSINMAENLKKVFAFLGLAPLGPNEMATIIGNEKKHNSRSNPNRAIGDMMPETRTLLHEFYKPYNKKLEELLGRKLWD